MIGDEENPFEKLRKSFETAQQNTSSGMQLLAEANELQIRGLVESLSTQQLDDLNWLFAGLAMEGKHNYGTLFLKGILVAERWRRNPLQVPDTSE